MNDLAATMVKTFVAVGSIAAVSLLASLAVMTLFADPPPVVRWFLTSAGIAGVSYCAAILIHWWTQ